MKTEIQLTDDEFRNAALIGFKRCTEAIIKGRELEPGRDTLRYNQDIQGSVAEYIFSACTGIPWRAAVGYLDTKLGDVGNFQIKSVLYRHYRLVVQETDPEHFNYVNVHVDLSEPTKVIGRLLGWAPGTVVKVSKNWVSQGGNIHRAAFFLPNHELRPMSTLPL